MRTPYILNSLYFSNIHSYESFQARVPYSNINSNPRLCTLSLMLDNSSFISMSVVQAKPSRSWTC